MTAMMSYARIFEIENACVIYGGPKMPHDRQVINYRGFQLISALFGGKYQGVIRDGTKEIYRVNGKNVDDVLIKLASHIDLTPTLYSRDVFETATHGKCQIIAYFDEESFIAKAMIGGVLVVETRSQAGTSDAIEQAKQKLDADPNIIDNTLIRNHEKFLADKGVEGSSEAGAKKVSEPKRHRVSHCWACHHPVDNALQYECEACGWIICFCGACGCTYDKRYQHQDRID